MWNAAALKSLARRCSSAFTRHDRERGREYYLLRRVLRTGEGEGEGRLTAVVAGSRRQPYRVAVAWDGRPGRLAVSCTCPRFADLGSCKHLWAAILAFDATGLSERVPDAGPLRVSPSPPGRLQDLDGESSQGEVPGDEEVHDEELDAGSFDVEPADDFGDWLETGREDATASARLAPPPRRGPRRPSWRESLGVLRRGLATAAEPGGAARVGAPPPQIWYVVNLQSCFAHGGLVVDFFQRRPRRDGTWGLVKPLSVNSERLFELPADGDRDLLELLSAAGGQASRAYSPYAPFAETRTRAAVVPRALYTTVLPRLAATGRLCWWAGTGQRPALDERLSWDPEPWRLQLRLERSASGGVGIRGELRRGEQTRPLSDPILLLASGLVLFRDSAAPFEPAGGFAWVVALRQEAALEIPAADEAEGLAALWRLPSLPPLSGPEELLPREEIVTPRPRLRVSVAPGWSRTTALRAELSFLYGDIAIADGDPRPRIVEPAGRLLLRRDREAERAARALLATFSLRPAPGHEPPALVVPERQLPDLAERLLAAGWEVEAEGVRLRRGGALRFSVTSGIDWLDLAVEAEIGGAPVALPELLAALRRGERFVRLGDGSRGLLPVEWLERLTPLQRLAAAGGGDTLRFAPTQALLLDALLADAPRVDADAAFARLRERLTAPIHPRPAAEPRGFRGELRPYQRLGLGWLGSLREAGLGGCLADDMGLGKTVQVLALLQGRRVRPLAAGDSRPSLVVAPRSLIFNWLDEAARFAPRLRLVDYTGADRAGRLSDLTRADLVVTTYGVARRDAARLREIAFDYVVLDEVQAVKNSATQSAKAVRLLRADHRLALTGTPVENHLGELWAILDFLNPGLLGKLGSLTRQGRDRGLSDGELAAVGRAVRPFLLRRRKEEVLSELPAKSEQTLLCTLGGRQRRLYEELRDHYRHSLAQRIGEVGLARSRIHVLEALLRLRQAACHPALVSPDHEAAGSVKLDLLLDQLRELVEEGHKALVFSQFTRFLGLARRRLVAAGIVHEYLDGRTRARKQKVDRFQQDPECRVFLISLKAGGTGLNLTAADYVFLLDPWWNPAVEAQAIDRTHRIGQQRPVFAYRLIARDTVEEKILALQADKRRLADTILAADASSFQRLTSAEIDLLLS